MLCPQQIMSPADPDRCLAERGIVFQTVDRLGALSPSIMSDPVQWDWVSVSKDEKFQVWESTRTEWKEFGTDIKLPIKMHGVRTHRVRPGEFYFEFDWLLGENVSEGIFDKETIGKIDFVP